MSVLTTKSCYYQTLQKRLNDLGSNSVVGKLMLLGKGKINACRLLFTIGRWLGKAYNQQIITPVFPVL